MPTFEKVFYIKYILIHYFLRVYPDIQSLWKGHGDWYGHYMGSKNAAL